MFLTLKNTHDSCAAPLTLEQGKICVMLGLDESQRTSLTCKLSSGDLILEDQENNAVSIASSDNIIKDELTVKEAILAAAKTSSQPLEIQGLLEVCNLSHQKECLCRELSPEQKQLLSLAEATVKNPKLLLCNGLTESLDNRSARIVLAAVEKLNQNYGITILIITSRDTISAMADQITYTKDGRIRGSLPNTRKVHAVDIAL